MRGTPSGTRMGGWYPPSLATSTSAPHAPSRASPKRASRLRPGGHEPSNRHASPNAWVVPISPTLRPQRRQPTPPHALHAGHAWQNAAPSLHQWTHSPTTTRGSERCVTATRASVCATVRLRRCTGAAYRSELRHYCDGETTRQRFRPADLPSLQSVPPLGCVIGGTSDETPPQQSSSRLCTMRGGLRDGGQRPPRM